MPKQRLVITSSDAQSFFLLLDGDTITLGRPGSDDAGVLENLRVVNVHCVLEVEGDQPTLRQDTAAGPGTPQELRPGEAVQSGSTRLCLQTAATPTEHEPPLLPVDTASTPETPSAAASGSIARRDKRLVVVDGADQGQTFMLPESGTVTLGKDRKYADIILHDLYVTKAHCRLKILGDRVEVVDDDGRGTQINGKSVRRQEMIAGDILRIGNSHLRLEIAEPGQKFGRPDLASAADDDEPVEIRVEDEEDADFEEVAEESAGEAEPLPANASEPVRLLHAWREKLAQLSGQPFGHYKLGPVLGRGRCGVVFQAEDAKTGQVVALKVFSPQFPQGNQELQRFASVMKAILPLRHPHLVGLVGAGKTSTYTWIAREYVEGDSLTTIIRRSAEKGQFNETRACRVALHIGGALDFARQQHLRHGKVNPANILIQRSDKSAKLADLMLGAFLHGSLLGKAVLEHRPAAELGYLAPEQADSEAFVDELSDIYGLGAVVFALLTGRPPFVGDTSEEVLEQLCGNNRVPRPSSINSAVSPDLEKVVLKMLARRQEERYATPAEMLADLEPIAARLNVEV